MISTIERPTIKPVHRGFLVVTDHKVETVEVLLSQKGFCGFEGDQVSIQISFGFVADLGGSIERLWPEHSVTVCDESLNLNYAADEF